MTDDMNAATRWRRLEQMTAEVTEGRAVDSASAKIDKFFQVEVDDGIGGVAAVFVIPMRGSSDGYECEAVRVRGNQIALDGPLRYRAPGSSLPPTTVVPASALRVECRVALVPATEARAAGDASTDAAVRPGARVVRVHAAAEIPPVPEVTIVVSGSFPRAPADDASWPARHMERFRSEAEALADALSGTLPGGTLDRLTSVLLARKASQLVVRSVVLAPDPAPAPTPPAQAPVPMLLHCPKCGARHVDEGEFATKIHHTHACQSCGMCWRPAVVATTGVRFLPGFRNEDPAAPGPIATSSPRDEHGHMRDEHGCIKCPKCGAGSGDDWSRCGDACPMPGSPHHRSCENGDDDPASVAEIETSNCPRCDSPKPHLHPAVQYGGEVQVCDHEFHRRVTPENTPDRVKEAGLGERTDPATKFGEVYRSSPYEFCQTAEPISGRMDGATSVIVPQGAETKS